MILDNKHTLFTIFC